MENITGMKRTKYCGDFRAEHIGESATVCGWVQRMRNLGGLIFIDLRDRSGIVQCTFDEAENAELFKKAFTVRSEFVLTIRGTVRSRGEGAITDRIPTGAVEILAEDMRILSKAQTPPFEIVENSDVNDVLRLKYRYLDLRRPDMQKYIALRHRITKIARDYYDENGFFEIETPILTKSTPEGARDYLVPSRVHPGKFYALPQSPQQYKQLLMLAGFDRYMQIARCFRDEDLRADRQPEFTQIDLEMSFADVDDVISVNEGLIARLWKEILGKEIKLPLPRMSYKEAMERFGSDKPDTRFGFELQDISDIAAKCEFKVFSGAIEAGGSVRMIKVDGGARFARKEIDGLAEWVKTYRAKGLAWLKLAEDGTMSSSFAKFLSEDEVKAIIDRAGAKNGDVIFVVADGNNEVVFASLGALRCECARRLDAIDPDRYDIFWIVEFPLFEYDEEEDRYVAKHHPFTAPMDEDVDTMMSDPASARAKAYDIVINGYEAGGGSIRIHSSDLQEKMFEALGFTKEAANDRFGHMIEAFSYGAPPHGGLAFGLDRLVMLLSGTDNIRDVIAFPKVQNASEIMMQSPDFVEDVQLTDLHIAVTEEKE
ncbi:MAG: aspartate--tRNA ligase [Oscillospiraceae bacterium]|nr:aspartate--tRNA ligase [Oscillospiraceae bacterium]MBQ4316519.1 aspartate--tRNA ligase [Oscillospiraceae bacterium]MBQ6698351.1 aspartate--tRNA ligase [Oscillospiraceae bacterium]MBQ7054185.1 aspartate--tRNA ligase [Oscillospiraceae bacterium]